MEAFETNRACNKSEMTSKNMIGTARDQPLVGRVGPQEEADEQHPTGSSCYDPDKGLQRHAARGICEACPAKEIMRHAADQASVSAFPHSFSSRTTNPRD